MMGCCHGFFACFFPYFFVKRVYLLAGRCYNGTVKNFGKEFNYEDQYFYQYAEA